ncbi:putative leucine-rich repeat-containing protein DDB_G0290503 isoform X2 [Macrosteles quadrilineatus]|uniref:putative leucine-rich repeat-containing protein DDB_G0290503 isoform X2 n=1 Tax=Macrosteles quadrilineatus TaxID=74068 RepID=UPI0023E315CB|nr:putative leucine-rich repeat-containing protein DDB_G0290503 isoform X2 [Macrosteles quadrilineatus]
MTAHAGVCVLIAVLVITEAAPDTSTWIRSPPQQTLHGLMVSIDERLQTLENARWEMTLRQTEQRLETLESSIRRLDSTFQDRLDKLERNLNSKELKDELTVEKLSHKIRDVMDSNYDRYNRRLSYTEEKLEMVLKKIQMTTEASLNRLEKQQEDVQTEVLEAVTLLEDLKSQSSTAEDKLNNTHRIIQQHIQLISPNQEELQKISGSLEHLGSRLNGSLPPIGVWSSQNDGPPTTDVLISLRREIGSEGTKITSKINNMYNDLWRRVMSVESLVKDLNKVANTTQREVLEVRSLIHPDNRDFPGDSQENFLEVALDALERKLQRRLLDLGRKVDDRLDTLTATQNLVMDSCFDGGICRGLESRLSQVLEKIFDVFSDKIEGFSNRTLDLDGLVMEMMELVKSQHSQLIRTVTHNTNMVVTLAKDHSDSTKLLQHSVSQLTHQTVNNLQGIHNEVSKISNQSANTCNKSEPAREDNILQKTHNLTNSTEETPFVSTTTETVLPTNTTIVEDKSEKNYDSGVLKITRDIDILADNSSVASASVLTPVVIKPFHPLTLDSSILQVIELMTSNLTQDQKDSLLRFLNSTISLDRLEAVIQNTEADPDDESGEMYNLEPLNKTDDEESSTAGNIQTTTLTTDLSLEENISDENNDDIHNEETTITLTMANGTTYMIDQKSNTTNSEDKPSGIPEDLKTLLKYYALIMKIKHGNLNISELWKPLQVSNSTENHNQSLLLPLVETLCFGEENIQSVATDSNSKMRERLLLIHQITSDKSLYERIENVCNSMNEKIVSKDSTEEMLQIELKHHE